MTETNPLLLDWNTPFHVAPFADIRVEHYAPALRVGMETQNREIQAIVDDRDAATFDNTVLAMEKSGHLLGRVAAVFFMLTMADTNPELQAVEQEMVPLLSMHSNALFQNEALFKRVAAVHASPAQLDKVQQRLVEKLYDAFVESGAALPPEQRRRVADLSVRISELQMQFQQNLLAEQQDFELRLDKPGDTAGLSQSLLDAALATGAERGHDGVPTITLKSSLSAPFLTFSERRDLRERVFRARLERGDRDNATDNKKILLEIAKLRAALAAELNYQTFAHYQLRDRMAKTPDTVHGFLDKLWSRIHPAAQAEKAELQQLAEEMGQNEQLEGWDWRFYAEKLKQKLVDLNSEDLRPYLQLDKIVAGVFDTAHRLFGLDFRPAPQAPTWHQDVRAWEVTRDGKHVALFYGDFFARPSKSDGAWMSELRVYDAIAHETPVIYNVCNFNKPAAGQPCLLSVLDAETIFHEFGHALHAMLTRAPYPTLAGTNVARDFVELPSQLMERWLHRDEILEKFALHHESGQPMPKDLRDKLRAALTFRNGFDKASYLSGAQLDMAWHALDKDQAANVDVKQLEQELRERLAMDAAIAYRPPSANFGHVFEGGYAAGYYGYIWAEVLDADAFEAFQETGDIFNKDVAKRLHDYIYSTGNSEDPAVLYEKFRGRPADPEALLRQLGLDAVPSQAVQ